MNKKVSIIIPAFNVEKYIDKCMKSILRQNYKNLEIIVINDGSTDNTLSIIKKYEKNDLRIKVINKRNEGVSKARNDGLRIASGDYTMFVDADDWIDDDTIEVCMDSLKEQEYDFIFFSYIREYKYNSLKRIIFEKSRNFSYSEVKNEILRPLIGPIDSELKNPIEMEKNNACWGKIYKTSIIKDIKFENVNNIGSEDLYFNILVTNKVRNARYIDNIFYHYNKINEKSITNIDNQNLINKWRKLYNKIEEFICINIEENERKTYYLALNNRIVINLINLNLRIVNSSLPYKVKKRILRQIINDEIYKDKLKRFSTRHMEMKWKVFFIACKWHLYNVILIMLEIANNLKSKC